MLQHQDKRKDLRNLLEMPTCQYGSYPEFARDSQRLVYFSVGACRGESRKIPTSLQAILSPLALAAVLASRHQN